MPPVRLSADPGKNRERANDAVGPLRLSLYTSLMNLNYILASRFGDGIVGLLNGGGKDIGSSLAIVDRIEGRADEIRESGRVARRDTARDTVLRYVVGDQIDI